MLKRLIARSYLVLPKPLQAAAVRVYLRRKTKRTAQLRTPTAVILYVTQRCNARCAHCFYWKELGSRPDELTLDEIRALARSFRHPATLSITGGEPFLRNDLYEIMQEFNRRNGCRSFSIATNGMLTSRVVETCERALRELRLVNLDVQVSLDGLERTHDEIRGVPAFRPAIETVKQLAELAKSDGRFLVHASCCVQKKNFDELHDFVEYMLPFRVPLRFGLLRGESFGTWHLPPGSSSGIDPRDMESPLVPLEQLEQFFDWLRARNERSEFKFWSPIQQATIGASLRMFHNPRRCVPCLAGSVDGVIYANGDVALCELTKPVGNLRDFGMDIEKLWHCEDANKMRSMTRSCACIHGCNLVTGLLFQPEHIHNSISRIAGVRPR